jgi:hypothetical protein
VPPFSWRTASPLMSSSLPLRVFLRPRQLDCR